MDATWIIIIGVLILLTIIVFTILKYGRDIDSQWLTRYAAELRKQFPDISKARLVQVLSTIEGIDPSRVQRTLEAEDFEPDPDPIHPLSNPYIAGPPIIEPSMFFGRKAHLKKITSLINGNFVLLSGQRRIGKTSLLHQLVYHLSQSKSWPEQYVPILVNLEGTPENEFFYTVMEEIVAGVKQNLPDIIVNDLAFDPNQSAAYLPRNFSHDLQILLKGLQARSPQPGRLVLLLDEMDVLNTYSLETQSQLRRIFQRFANTNLSVVVSGVNLNRQWAGESSPFYNMFMPVPLTSFPVEEARRLITEPVKGKYRYTDEAVEHIIETTSGLPHRIQQLCWETLHRLQLDSPRRTNISVEDVDAVLKEIRWLDGDAALPDELLNLPENQEWPAIAEERIQYETTPDDKEDS